MQFFLTLKHWQLFALLFGVPVLFELLVLAVAINGPDIQLMMFVFPILMLALLVLYFSWFYTLGTRLHEKLPEGVHMNLGRFQLFLFFPLVYIGFAIFFFVSMISHAGRGEPNFGLLAIFVVLHLFSMFCIFYCLYFISKALKTVESGRELGFGDFAGEFFLLWFSFIGIWILQPRINKIFDQSLNQVE